MVYITFKSSLGFDFVWDDREVIVNNMHISSFSSDNLLWAFTTTFSGNYLPLTWLSFMLDYQVWGLDSYGFRLTNIVLHSINAILLMLAIYSFLKCIYKESINNRLLLISSFTGALIFSLHPLRVESVVWVTERKDVLSAFFLLLSFLSYLHFKFRIDVVLTDSKAKILYIISFSCFFLSLLCKAWAITFPVVLVLLDMAMIYPTRISRSLLQDSIKTKLPFILMSALFALIAIFGQDSSGAMISWEALTLTDRVLQGSYGFNMYLVHTLFPSDLSPLYWLGKTNFHVIKFYLHFFVFISIFLVAFIIRKKCHWPLYFFLIYLVIVSPVLGFTQSGAQIMADRYTYIALMPFSIVVAWLILRLIVLVTDLKNWKYKIILTTSIISACVFIMLILVNVTHEQIVIWKNEETLWSRAIDVDAFNLLALNNRADYRATERLYKESFDDYTSVLAIDEENAYALNGRAATRINTGDLQGAIKDLDAALIILPTYVDALFNRGVSLHNTGNTDLAINDFLNVIKLLPNHIQAHFYLGISYYSKNEFDKAITVFTRVNNVSTGHMGSIYYRALSYIQMKEYGSAKKDFEYITSIADKGSALYTNAQQQLSFFNNPDI